MSYILIIGAKSDIAKALAKKYAQGGYDLYLAARNANDLEQFANALIATTKRDVKRVELNILDFDAHQKFYTDLGERPEGVIVAAGYLGDQNRAQVEFSEAKKIIDTNYTGVVSLLNIIAEDYKQTNQGFIVAISSVAGDRGRKSNYIYGSAKAALTTYLSGLRMRLNADNVHVLTVKPGFVDTKMTKGMKLPARLTATADEVANDIFQAQQNKKNVLYTKRVWQWIMRLICVIPERIFKRINL